MKTQLFARMAAIGLLILLSLAGHTSAGATDAPTSRIDSLLAGWDGDDRPGVAVAVIHDGEIVYQNGFGMADLERNVPITPESAFEIGSISKQFTAMCILLLENDGKLKLDDDIRTYVPEMPEYEKPITIRHLLHHTSGVRDIETLVPLAGVPWFNYISAGQLLEMIARQKALNFPPGEQFLYSNSGYILLARVVSRVSGQSLRDFAEERIFGPLGMKHTVFWDTPGQIVPGRALAYSPQGDDGYRLEMWNMPFDGPAGIYTTIGDFALWDANFYDNRLGGGAALIEKMETPGLLNNGESCGYAAGLGVGTHGGLPTFRHGGAWMGYRAAVRRYPGQHFTILLLSNTSSIYFDIGQIASLYLADELAPSGQAPAEYTPPIPVDLEAAELARWEGSYWNEPGMLLRTIESRDGSLYYVRGGGSDTELGAIEAGRFFMTGYQIPVGVDFQGSGEARTMTVQIEDREPILFEAVPSLSTGELTAFSGVFWSEELLRELRITVGGDAITASWADEESGTTGHLVGPNAVLLPRFIPIPWNPQATMLRFDRNGAGEITGLSLSCDMVRGVSFTKRP